MRHISLASIFLAFTLMLAACGGGGTDVVESGTYTGTIDELNPEETEIYVETEDGQRLELYFTDTTTLTQGGQTVPFSTLQTGQQVQVEVEKTGQRLDPISVEILQ
ncbi:hypothetical protein [Fodinibius sediminis]|uniref:DUF5666 domain-containing protein n=1 Tax=Fodinibius sediminis TaxID=1214077 RepID=A0A521EFQ2_9BACT|nr:hypothetical protein [Fodinibius sediminis]SMO82753.1 hypothetical protein SAMN06265218_11627 [Fodinibius sediminis]